MLGDAKLVLGQLIEAVRDRLGAKTRSNNVAQEVGAKREEWLARWHPKLHLHEHPINPYRVIADFMRVVDPAEAIVTHNSGSPRERLNPFYRATRPRGYLGWGKSPSARHRARPGHRRQGRRPRQVLRQLHGRRRLWHDRSRFRDRGALRHPDHHDRLKQFDDGDRDPRDEVRRTKDTVRDLGGNYANIAKDLGGWSERVDDPAEIGPAILRARRQNDDGRAALLEFVTSQEQGFSHRRGAAE